MGTPMAKKKRMKTKTFSISYHSEEEEQTFEGDFTAKRPTVGMQARIAVESSRILDGEIQDFDDPAEKSRVPEYATTAAEMLGYLKVVLIEGPDWWMEEKGDDIYDFGLVTAIYKEAVEVDPFRKRTIQTQFPDLFQPEDRPGSGGESDGGGGGGSHQEPDRTGPDDVVASLVDSEVQEASDQPGVAGE